MKKKQKEHNAVKILIIEAGSRGIKGANHSTFMTNLERCLFDRNFEELILWRAKSYSLLYLSSFPCLLFTL